MIDEIERIRLCQNMLFGVAFGDALGATAEFTDPGTADHRDMIGGGVFRWEPGSWTDDTDQTVMVAEAVVANPGDPGGVAAQTMRDLRVWLANDPRDVGMTTQAGIEGTPTLDSEANGSLMRAAPIGAIRNPIVRAAAARKTSQLTHPNDVCVDICMAYAEAIAAGLAGQSHWEHLDRDGYTAGVDGGSFLSVCPWPMDGHVKRSWWIASWAVGRLVEQSPRSLDCEEILLEIVHAGGDADTHAAIAGGLLGALGGTWPDRWFSQVAGGPFLTVLANQLAEIGRDK